MFPVEEAPRLGADGKLRVFWVRVAVARSEDLDQDIQATADAIEDGSAFSVDNRRNVFDGTERTSFSSELRVRIVNNTIRGTTPPGFNSPFEHIELGYGPIN